LREPLHFTLRRRRSHVQAALSLGEYAITAIQPATGMDGRRLLQLTSHVVYGTKKQTEIPTRSRLPCRSRTASPFQICPTPVTGEITLVLGHDGGRYYKQRLRAVHRVTTLLSRRCCERKVTSGLACCTQFCLEMSRHVLVVLSLVTELPPHKLPRIRRPKDGGK
jgi:hypothetical protein